MVHGTSYSRVFEHINLSSGVFSSNSSRQWWSLWKLLLSPDFTSTAKRLFKALTACATDIHLSKIPKPPRSQESCSNNQSLSPWQVDQCFLYVMKKRSINYSRCFTVKGSFNLYSRDVLMWATVCGFPLHLQRPVKIFSSRVMLVTSLCSQGTRYAKRTATALLLFSFSPTSSAPHQTHFRPEREASRLCVCKDEQMSVTGSVICDGSFLDTQIAATTPVFDTIFTATDDSH